MSYPTPNLLTYKASAALAKGKVVKGGADEQHLVVASAATDKAIGICQSVAEAAEDPIEVAHPGGGGLALIGAGGCAVGDYLAADANGALVVTTTANNKVMAQALKAGAEGDLVPVNVVSFNY